MLTPSQICYDHNHNKHHDQNNYADAESEADAESLDDAFADAFSEVAGDEPDELLFDATEAHPDASGDVTVMVDPAGTEPQGLLGHEERSG